MFLFTLILSASPLTSMSVPADNASSAAKVKLGNALFFDKRLSADGSRACYSCHLNEDGTGGHDALAIGAKDKKLTRHSPVMWNVGYLTRLYWDGRSNTLEAQGKAAWAGGNMGVGNDNLVAKAKELEPFYKDQFEAVFPGEGVTPDNIVKALSAYERTFVCDDTAFDKFVAGKKNALSAQQQKGWALFTGKAACATCHAAPFFSATYEAPEGMFYNVGIGTQAAEPDQGRMVVTKQERDWAAFKVPSLRNIAKSAPYFHDGSVAKLEDAVKLMASGGIDNKNKTTSLVDRKLTADELASLVAFLHALDCPGSLKKP